MPEPMMREVYDHRRPEAGSVSAARLAFANKMHSPMLGVCLPTTHAELLVQFRECGVGARRRIGRRIVL